MLTLLLVVIICGIVAYGIKASPMDDFFKVVAYCILAIIVVGAFFQIVLHVNVSFGLR